MWNQLAWNAKDPFVFPFKPQFYIFKTLSDQYIFGMLFQHISLKVSKYVK